jgi:hypothetical protein
MSGGGGEALIGLALGFVLQIAFAAPIIAAEVIGGAMGMSMATAVDPNSGAQSPALGQYFTVVLTLVFLGLGAHLTGCGWWSKATAPFRRAAPGSAPGRLDRHRSALAVTCSPPRSPLPCRSRWCCCWCRS